MKSPSLTDILVEGIALLLIFGMQYLAIVTWTGGCLEQPTAKDVTLCILERIRGMHHASQCLGFAPRGPYFTEAVCHALFSPLPPPPPPLHPTMAAILDGYWH